MTNLQCIILVAQALLCIRGVVAQTTTPIGGYSGSHTDIPRWCGKSYSKGSPNFNPGGQVEPPAPSANPLLQVRVEPRHSVYDSSEDGGEMIVDAIVSRFRGKPIVSPHFGSWLSSQPMSFGDLDIKAILGDTNQTLFSGTVAINSTDNIFPFSFTSIEPRLNPYRVQLTATATHDFHKGIYEATSDLYYLPAKNSGSTVKVDKLYGGMIVANNATNYTFQPLLPFGFYTDCSGYLNYSLANVSAYKDFGFNAINPICAFTDGDLGFLFDWMDSLDLWYQYDMRNSYLNLSSVAEQIPLIKDRSNLLSWYTADEPDGWQYALNSTRLAYDLLKEHDPYHPTGLVLNCHDYYFEEYTSGTDFIMEDAYPVGIDPTYSRRWGTPVNDTYGDCGCDDCIGELQDVSNRLDDFVKYEQWLGLPEKPLWAVLQAFSGEGYWARDPTPKETWAMMILSFNHNAKAIMSWTFPTSTLLETSHGEMAKAVTQPDVSSFLLGSDPIAIQVSGCPLLDVAYWTAGKGILIAIANLDATFENGTVEIQLPINATSISSQPWGSLSWDLQEGGKLRTYGLDDYATSILILDG